jgi:hypothetical protein
MRTVPPKVSMLVSDPIPDVPENVTEILEWNIVPANISVQVYEKVHVA